MNVIIGNTQSHTLANLDIDVIKSITGEFDADEIVSMFKNFFYARMIIDITAIKNYEDFNNIQKLSIDLEADKLIFLLPETSVASSPSYLTRIISMGIYNFTTNLDGVKYLLEHPNTYKDVAHIQQFNTLSSTVSDKVMNGSRIIGIKNVTTHAGATTLVYMLKKELERNYGDSIYAIEVDKNDLSYFNDKNVISTTKNNLQNEIYKLRDATVILVDLNDDGDEGVCQEVLYLIEPSSIKLNRLIRKDRKVFSKLEGRKIVLNKSLLTNKDIVDFEYEAKAKVFFNIPPLDERKRNSVITNFLEHIGLLEKKEEKNEDAKIFGLFRR